MRTAIKVANSRTAAETPMPTPTLTADFLLVLEKEEEEPPELLPPLEDPDPLPLPPYPV